MTRLRRAVIALFAASVLATASVGPAFAAQDLVGVCRLSGNGSLIFMFVNTQAWNDVLFPNRDRNGFLYAGAACTT